jgi:hypothetical protein
LAWNMDFSMRLEPNVSAALRAVLLPGAPPNPSVYYMRD